MTIRLGGILPALVTPFTPGGAPDLESLEVLTGHLAASGAGGLLLFDHASEAEKLTLPEMQAIVETVVRKTAGSIPVIVSIGNTDPQQAAHLAGNGAVTAFMAPSPRTLPPESRLNAPLFRSFKKAAGIPVILDYTFPAGNSPLESAENDGLLDSLDMVDSVRVNQPPAGPLISALRERSGGATPIISGLSGMHILDSLDRGAGGATTLCCIPEAFTSITRYLEHGAHKEANRTYDELLPLLSLATQSVAMTTACEKTILARRGWISSDARRNPSYNPDAKQRSDLFTLYENLAQIFQLP